MRRFLNLFLIITLSFCGTLLRAQNSFASTNDFYFESFDGEYFLDKADDGTSRMSVEETLVAVFPDFDQNHGIERCIPQTYRNVSTLAHANFSVTRNNLKEPYSTYSEGEYLCLRIGSASSYVRGTQTYKISYVLENVILNPDNSDLQELYWDINGTGWYQQFNSLTATLTLSDNVASAWKNTAYCYVGRYKTSGEDATSRCEISKNAKSVTFKTKANGKSYRYDTDLEQEVLFSGVSAGETMTIDLEFEPDTFTIKEPEKSYLLMIILGVFGLFLLFLVYLWIKAENKIKDKKKLAKSKVIAPEFAPKAGFTVAEMAQNYLGTLPGSSRVATLLELAVQHKISLEKGEKKTFGGYKWKIHVKSLEGISREQQIILEILNGGSSVSEGDIIEVKKYTSTSRLRSLDSSFTTTTEMSLERKDLFEKKASRKSSSKLVIFVNLFFILFFIFGGTFISLIDAAVTENSGKIYVGAEIFFPVIFTGFFVVIFAFILVSTNISKYQKRTLEGIKASKYLDGLKRYMKLAEADRLKFLQSVNGADTSSEGIVKLYEKLLPYAVLFKLEDSWLKELNKYYELENISSPDWVAAGVLISSSDFRSFTSYTSSSISSSTASESSGSSGGGGGGGGGFSGGGGGGGGGGGW